MKPNSKSSARAMLSLPPEWRDELMGSALEPVKGGLSGAAVFRVGGPDAPRLYVKVATRTAARDLLREADRTKWLGARGLRVPAILRVHEDDRRVAVMMSPVPGVTPDACRRPAAEVVARLGAAMAAFHAVPIEDCRYDETVAARLARARDDIARGAVDPDAFEPRNRRRTPEQLYSRLAASVPGCEDLVLVQGDATFDNILIDADGNVGFIDCGRAGKGDRYVDLALMAAEIGEHFGTEWISPFARAYGLPAWDAAKARWFSDLYELF